MYKYVKSAIDEDEVGRLGLISLWKTSEGRRDIISEIEKVRTSDIIDFLEDSLDDEEFQDIMIKIASVVLE